MIQFKRVDPNAVLPRRADPGDAGFDMSSVETFELLPGQRRLYKTGIQCAIPEGWAGIIKPRSGLAFKKGIDVLAGVIDSSYRGEVCVLLQNHGDAIVSIRIGDRIAQMVVMPYMGEAVEVDELNDTERGEGGFGSTGQ